MAKIWHDYVCKLCGLGGSAMSVGRIRGRSNRVLGCYDCITVKECAPVDHGPSYTLTDEDVLNAEAEVETLEGLEERMVADEEDIAKEYGIALVGEPLREEIVRRLRAGEVSETNLVQSWLGNYSAWKRWQRSA